MSTRADIFQSVRCLRNPYLFLWTIFILLFPFYVFSSGLPQPADMVMSVGLLLMMGGMRVRMHRSAFGPLRSLFLFVGYVIVINLVWSVIEDKYTFNTKEGFLLSPLFYIYNAAVFMAGCALYSKYGRAFLVLTTYAVILSLLFQTAASTVYRGETLGGRGTLFFNNPNQLGYYALLSASIIAYGCKRLSLSALSQGALYLCCAYLATLSASKAALYSVAALAVVTLVHRARTMIVTAVLLGGALYFVEPTAWDDARARLASDDDDDQIGVLEGRGYDRLWEHPEHLVVGAGEGGLARFPTEALGTHELHSSIGTLLFSYGVVGTLLFSVFVLRLLPGMTFLSSMLLVPAGLYGLTHQALRFSLLWILLLMALCTTNREDP